MKFRLKKEISSFIINAINKIHRSKSEDYLYLKPSTSSIFQEKSNKDETNKNNILFQKILKSKIPKNILKIINSPKLQLDSDEYFEEIENEKNNNIIYNNNEIQYISIDLFIFMVGKGNYDNDFLVVFTEQCFAFIGLERLIKKILNALKYFEIKKQTHLINFLTIINEFINSKHILNE